MGPETYHSVAVNPQTQPGRKDKIQRLGTVNDLIL